jgi:hypothetical protein
MKATELRIGNTLDYHVQTVTVMAIDRNKATFGYFVDSIGFDRAFDNPDFPKPIPITEEWLIKFGFQKIAHKIDIFEKERIRVWLGSRGSCLCYLIEEDTTTAHYISNTFEYIHQLQNLYFALTGEELKLHEGNQ